MATKNQQYAPISGETNGQYLYRLTLELTTSGAFSSKVLPLGPKNEEEFKSRLLTHDISDAMLSFETVEKLRRDLKLTEEQANAFAAITDIPVWNLIQGFSTARIRQVMMHVYLAAIKYKDCWAF